MSPSICNRISPPPQELFFDIWSSSGVQFLPSTPDRSCLVPLIAGLQRSTYSLFTHNSKIDRVEIRTRFADSVFCANNHYATQKVFSHFLIKKKDILYLLLRTHPLKKETTARMMQWLSNLSHMLSFDSRYELKAYKTLY